MLRNDWVKKMKISLASFLVLSMFMMVQGSWLDIQNECCLRGMEWADEGRCHSYNRVLHGILRSKHQQCKSIIEICCMKKIHRNQCISGRIDAQKDLPCSINSTAYGTEQYRQCCVCCKLGKIAHNSGLSCNLTSFGEPCDSTFTMCCSGTNNSKESNQCLEDNPCEQICTDSGLSVECSCKNGFRLNPDQKTCSDKNECLENTSICPQGHLCLNSLGSYTCEVTDQCPQNSTYNALSKSCQCLYGMFYDFTSKRCRCDNNYGFNVQLKKCDDIDECTIGSHNCSNPSNCINTKGGFYCRCSSGLVYNEEVDSCDDINECSEIDCGLGRTCFNNRGSFVCRRTAGCGTGYTLNEVTDKCDDIDECRTNTHTCASNQECINLNGTFRCKQNLLCMKGLRQDISGMCVDINECAERTSSCLRYQQCVNIHGSYFCRGAINCGFGYVFDTNHLQCVDIDECIYGNNSCRSPQRCHNTQGSYECICPKGYAVRQGDCTDIDECSRYRAICPLTAVCTNTPGSYRCSCKTGYQNVIGNSGFCTDINECLEQNRCEHICTNLPGSFHCSCRIGFQLAPDSRTCRDVDECARPFKQCKYVCENTHGSFSCSCPSGFRTKDRFDCKDIDECAEGTARCSGIDNVCININGGYRCPRIQCPSGYSKTTYGSNSVRCQRPRICPPRDVECFTSAVSISYNFFTLSTKIQVPALLFTIVGQSGQSAVKQFYRFNLKLISAIPQEADVKPVTRNYFRLWKEERVGRMELLRAIPSPQDVELELTMDIYSSRNQKFQGQAISKIFIYSTKK